MIQPLKRLISISDLLYILQYWLLSNKVLVSELVMNNTDDVYDPSGNLVNSNLAFAILLTIVSSSLTGIVLLPIVLLKNLRSQPYHLLLGNYLSSSLAIVLGSGLYRAVQIMRYLATDYDNAAERTNCIANSFSEFPFVVSTYSLCFVGLERFIFLFLDFKRIDIYTTAVFILIPWAIGITRYSVILGDSSSRYSNNPYLGLCMDITEERDGRRIVHFFFDIVIPVLFTIIVLSVNYSKIYSSYKLVEAKLSYDREEENSQLLEKKKKIMKVIKDLYIVVVFFGIRLITIIAVTLLAREYANEENSQQQRESSVTAALILLLFEPCVIPVVFAVLNVEVWIETFRYFQSPS